MTSDHFAYAGDNLNTGNKSGKSYWSDMRMIYQRLVQLLPRNGLMILIVKNHIKAGKLIDITTQTIAELEAIGLDLAACHGRFIDRPSLWQRRRKEQGLSIVEVEDILVFRKATS